MDFKNLLKLFAGGEVTQAGSPMGSACNVPEVSHMIAQGMGRHVTVGAFSTGIVGGGAGTILDLDQPELVIGVPAGYCMRPIRMSAQVQVGLFAADNDESEILFAVDSLGLWSGDGTYTFEEPSNMRTDLVKGSACRVGSAFTADMTTTQPGITPADPILDIELARSVETSDLFSTGTGILIKRLDLTYEPLNAPYLVGPCSLLAYFGGTIATIGGFVQVAWVEGRYQDFFQK